MKLRIGYSFFGDCMKLVIRCVICGRILHGRTNSSAPPYGRVSVHRGKLYCYLPIVCDRHPYIEGHDTTVYPVESDNDKFERFMQFLDMVIKVGDQAIKVIDLLKTGAELILCGLTGLAGTFWGVLGTWLIMRNRGDPVIYLDQDGNVNMSSVSGSFKQRVKVTDELELSAANTATYKNIQVLPVGSVDPTVHEVFLEWAELDINQGLMDANAAQQNAALHYGKVTTTSSSIDESDYIPGTRTESFCVSSSTKDFSGVNPRIARYMPGFINLPVESDGSVHVTISATSSGFSTAKAKTTVCIVASVWRK